jgi:hypothetical protein
MTIEIGADVEQFIRVKYTSGLSDSQVMVALQEELGVMMSRNAIIGLRHRRGILRDGPMVQGARKGAEVRKTRAKVQAMTRVDVKVIRAARNRELDHLPKDVFPEIKEKKPLMVCDDWAHDDSQSVSIMELTDQTCRWPLSQAWEYPPYKYCGMKPDADSSYCQHHRQRGTRELPVSNKLLENSDGYIKHFQTRLLPSKEGDRE